MPAPSTGVSRTTNSATYKCLCMLHWCSSLRQIWKINIVPQDLSLPNVMMISISYYSSHFSVIKGKSITALQFFLSRPYAKWAIIDSGHLFTLLMVNKTTIHWLSRVMLMLSGGLLLSVAASLKASVTNWFGPADLQIPAFSRCYWIFSSVTNRTRKYFIIFLTTWTHSIPSTI